MDTLLGGFSTSMNEFKHNPNTISSCSNQSHVVNGFKLEQFHFSDPSILPNTSSQPPPSHEESSPDSSSSASWDGEVPEENDPASTAILKYLSDMLMEEDLHKQNCMFQDCMALQAAEKSFYEVLNNEKPFIDRNLDYPDANSTSGGCNFGAESNWVGDVGEFQYSDEQVSHVGNDFESILQSYSMSLSSSDSFSDSVDGLVESPVSTLLVPSQPPWRFQDAEEEAKARKFLAADDDSVVYSLEQGRKNAEVGNYKMQNSPDSMKGRKNHQREGRDLEEAWRSSKHSAIFIDASEDLDMFDKVLLCNGYCKEGGALRKGAGRKLQQNGQSKGSKSGSKKRGGNTEMVDLRGLLTQCAQTVASNDRRTATELLKQIRQHSSAYGDGSQRLAHYFADGLEARLLGTRTPLQTIHATRTPAAEILKAYQVYVTSCPFKQMSNMFANKTIAKQAAKATRIHIIDFGICYGFQWPCLIQGLSKRHGGPPKLRITGIELPQPGFRPAERVEETGRRLAKYCERFNVPFEYIPIAQKWETIQLEDLKIDRDEMVFVNCLYRLGNLPDDTIVSSSPRDTVLNLIKRINPYMFIHGVVNGTYNAPFFLTRFRETLFHFSALFDMFEATVPPEDEDRLMFEKEIFGRDAVNILACEGLERFHRPETYKQWQARNVRAGFRQLPLDEDLFKQVRTTVKSGYHKEFVVDENGGWMLQGWKGRIIYSLSCWKPAN